MKILKVFFRKNRISVKTRKITCLSDIISLPSSEKDVDRMIEDLKNISTNQGKDNYVNFREEDDVDCSPSDLFGEEKERDKRIDMNDISCIADGSQGLVSF